MRRLFWATVIGAFWFFWPPELFAEERIEPIDLAVELRRCLKDDVALSIAPGATAPLIAFQNHRFIVWPIDALSTSTRMLTAYNVGGDAPVFVIEFVETNDGRTSADSVILNRVADCGDAAWFVLSTMGKR